VSKVAAHWYAKNYREAYELFVRNGILFNHESLRRGETFVTRKITRAVTRIKLGIQKKLYLSNLEARPDWGFAGTFVEAMYLMLQRDAADDYVVATGESDSIREFLDIAGEARDLDWRKFVELNLRYLRPTELDHLCGDPSKARRTLGWKPKVTFEELVRMMVRSDLDLARQELTLTEPGHNPIIRGAAYA
jgi:GDPmannose 4,6-dehydratase